MLGDWFWDIVIGILAGFLSAVLIKGRGLGCFFNLLIGISGAFIGNKFVEIIGIPLTANNPVERLAIATFGAIIFLVLFNLIFKKDAN